MPYTFLLIVSAGSRSYGKEKYLKVKDVFKQFRKSLSRVVPIAHRTTGADLPDLDDIYSSGRLSCAFNFVNDPTGHATANLSLSLQGDNIAP